MNICSLLVVYAVLLQSHGQTFDCSTAKCEEVMCIESSVNCYINCKQGGCTDIEINANNVFNLGIDCGATNICKDSKIKIEGSVVNDVSINCNEGDNSCENIEMNIEMDSVGHDLNIACGFVGGSWDNMCANAKIDVEIEGSLGGDLIITCGGSGDNMCANAKIDIEIEGNLGNYLELYCDGNNACPNIEYNVKVGGSIGEEIFVYCGEDGQESTCTNAKMNFEVEDNVIGYVYITCESNNGCANAQISIDATVLDSDGIEIWCWNNIACESAQFEVKGSADHVYMGCDGDNACLNVEFEADDFIGDVQIYCGNDDPVRRRLGETRQLLGVNNECENTKIECGKGECILFCKSGTSCIGVEVDAEESSSFICNPAKNCDAVEEVELPEGSDESSDSSDSSELVKASFVNNKMDHTSNTSRHIMIRLNTETIITMWTLFTVYVLFMTVYVWIKKRADAKN